MTSAYGVSLWMFIRNGKLNFSKLLRYDVGKGTRVKFGSMCGVGIVPLKKLF